MFDVRCLRFDLEDCAQAQGLNHTSNIKLHTFGAIRDGSVTACLLLNESASYYQWRA